MVLAIDPLGASEGKIDDKNGRLQERPLGLWGIQIGVRVLLCKARSRSVRAEHDAVRTTVLLGAHCAPT